MPKKIDFEVVETSTRGVEIFNIPGPDMLKDKLIPLNTQGAEQLGKRFGQVPARASLVRWRINGFPIERGGPCVRLPTVTRLKRVFTTTSAMRNWLLFINHLSDEIREAGGVIAWRHRRKGTRSVNHAKV